MSAVGQDATLEEEVWDDAWAPRGAEVPVSGSRRSGGKAKAKAKVVAKAKGVSKKWPSDSMTPGGDLRLPQVPGQQVHAQPLLYPPQENVGQSRLSATP